ncbi:ChaN family lipoprotein [Ramlibacter sp. AW1]|uniref:ChaN family lipoprotein n=1 Tax=Ramlibacter aurantiacus TaxID=2801330 RepID=A0A936ZP29_9BURK|nr:ChaN family lipoprotein [Ramlibacter aurantiacus]MBL0421156.1 ChaN family lipoprotein [Ramlibacter aurantiacus]
MLRLITPLGLAGALAACGHLAPASTTLPDALLLGEQHDAPQHKRWHHETVRDLARRERLAALALEMAERGASTAHLPREASQEQVRAALRWEERAWPWAAYGPAVMEAVRAGVPVIGVNLPRAHMRAAMADANLERALPAEALARQQTAVREGHCDLLPESQVLPMVRVQIARDRSMAEGVAAAATRGRTVVLLAGSGHVDEALGVPRHLPPGLSVEPRAWPPAEGSRSVEDACAELRQHFRPRP